MMKEQELLNIYKVSGIHNMSIISFSTEASANTNDWYIPKPTAREGKIVSELMEGITPDNEYETIPENWLPELEEV